MTALTRLLAIAVALLVVASAARADDKRPLDSLPLPALTGKTPAVKAGQKAFRVPLGFARVEKFYRDALGADPRITIAVERGAAGRTLTLTSKRPSDAWLTAVIREGTVDTLIEVTPVVRLAGDVIDGRPAQPLVHFVMPANREVARQAQSIDHMNAHLNGPK